MLNLGFFEFMLFGIIALIVLGPEKLPIAARTLGKWYAKIRRMSARLQSEFVSELQLLEVQEELKNELTKIKESEAKIQAQMAELQRTLDKTKRTAHANKQHIMDAWQDNHLKNDDLTDNTADRTSSNDGAIDDNSKGDDRGNNPTKSAEGLSESTATLETAFNIPMVNRWFLLGNYDKKRRLPTAPFLPNHQADPLLYTHDTYAQTSKTP
ncbi:MULTISPECIES: Sec-independent protein translocase protein TatB [unclassified Moraxella]|uniref:Sec-independent protein translocase protein TatB n=1 Tax=unclassified Moraxella TaxID=2685852 RepID=UPI002B4108A6|nr:MULTISPECIES: Sec-independent protein translocase protein TatB [unclassified Moraxella]